MNCDARMKMPSGWPGKGLRKPMLAGMAYALLAGAWVSPSQAVVETVTVQARATEEEIRDIPVAITAVSAETMDKYGLRNIEDVAAFTPSLEIQRISSGSGSNISCLLYTSPSPRD